VKAEAEAKAKKDAKARQKKIDSAEFPSERALAKIIRDPDSHTGEIIKIWGEVTQYDSATGLNQFRADVANKNTMSYSFFDGENAILMGTSEMFSDLIKDDLFTATVEVTMSYTYETAIGGTATVPVFTVLSIKPES
jgi:hypothetical protein